MYYRLFVEWFFFYSVGYFFFAFIRFRRFQRLVRIDLFALTIMSGIPLFKFCKFDLDDSMALDIVVQIVIDSSVLVALKHNGT